MATPRGARHQDLEQRLKDMERQLHEMRSTLLRRSRLEVTDGDFAVSGGGSVTVSDGGSVKVRGGGDVDVRGGNFVTDGAVQVVDSGRLDWYDTQGRQRVKIGGLTADGSTEVIAHGILVQYADGQDVIYADDEGFAVSTVNRPGHDQFVFYTGDGYPDGWQLFDVDTDEYLSVGTVGADGAGIWGGKEGNGTLSTLLEFLGSASGARGLRVRDGANSVFADLECGTLTEHTSNAGTKHVLGEPDDDDPLATVQRVPIKRWRHKRGGRGVRMPARGRAGQADAPVTDPDSEPDTPPVRIGPMVEDLPDELVKRGPDGDGIKVSAAVWTLWRAVQQLSRRVAELEDRQSG